MEWLRVLRGEKTQKEAANEAGISDAFYSMIESGLRRPSPEVAKKIAVALNFEKHGLDWTKFFDEDKPKPA